MPFVFRLFLLRALVGSVVQVIRSFVDAAIKKKFAAHLKTLHGVLLSTLKNKDVGM